VWSASVTSSSLNGFTTAMTTFTGTSSPPRWTV
jgi:hypothetical protein